MNGVEVISHSIGHLPFEVEITDSLKFGAQNRLTVLCNNTLTRSTIPQGELVKLLTDTGNQTLQTYTFDFFNYAGIHRSVVLYTTPKVYIKDISITTDVLMSSNLVENNEDQEMIDNPNLEIEGIVGLIHFNVTIAGFDSDEDTELPIYSSYYLHIQLRAADEIVAHELCKESHFNGTLRVDNPRLWWPYLMNPDYGYLYTLEIYLHSAVDESLIDVYRMKIGIRKLAWDETSFLMNGRKVYLHGFGRHEDSDVSI